MLIAKQKIRFKTINTSGLWHGR